jgi:hypothetical protein
MNDVCLFSSTKFKRNNRIFFVMENDPVTCLLKFAQFATGQIRDINRLGERLVRRKRVMRGRTSNCMYSCCIKQGGNTWAQENPEVNCGNVDSKSVLQEEVSYVNSWQEHNSVKHTEIHVKGNTQENSSEYSLYNQDPANLAVQEEWPNYTDRFLFYMSTVDERIPFQHDTDADGYY